MLFIGYILFMAALFSYEWSRIRVRGDARGERIAFIAFMLFALGLGVATILKWPLPDPTKAIQRIFQPFTMPS